MAGRLMEPTNVRFVAYGGPARAALAEAIATAKGDDALSPVTVGVPSNYAGLSLRRWFASDGLPGGDRPGIANVRFMALARVTELVGAPQLVAEGRTPLLGPIRAEAVRAAVAANPGPFGDVAQLRPTLQSIDASFRDLRQASVPGLDAIAAQGGRTRHIVALFRDFEERTAGYYDDHDLARAASEAVRHDSSALVALGDLVVFLPDRVPPAQKDFLQSMLDLQRAAVIVGLTGDERADEEARAQWGSAGEHNGSDDAPAGTTVVSVADPEEEVREVLRRIGASMAGGTPLHRMAVVYRNENPYRLIAAEQLSAAGIPWNGPAVSTLGQTLAGRALLGFLEAEREQFSRETVTEWLSSAPIIDPATGRLVACYQWATLAQRAGVTKGVGQWDGWLARRADTLRADRDRMARDEDDPGRRIGQIDAEFAGIDALRAFMRDVVEHAGDRAGGSWGALASWAEGVLKRFLGDGAAWPDEEIEALKAVQEVVGQLAGVEALTANPGLAVFRTALEQALERPSGRRGNFGDGVFVGRLADVAGLKLDSLFVLGMSEGSFPPTAREDPLVRDAERVAAGLPLSSSRALAERRQYLAALMSAEKRVLSFPRADLRGRRGTLPSPWLVETVSRHAGEPVYASEVEELSDQPWFDTTPSFESAVLNDREPAHLQEFDTRSLRRWRLAGGDAKDHHLAAGDMGLRAGFELQQARTEGGFTRWAGSVDVSGARSPFEGKPLSATALQDWATCPFRYFAGRVLKVEEPDEEDDELTISALDRGRLIHEILDRFFAVAPRLSEPEDSWSPADGGLLRGIAGDVFREAVEEGGVGHPFVWQSVRETIIKDLDQFLLRDARLRSDFGTVQTASERSFGMDGAPELRVDVSPGKTIRLRGRIDRIDESGAGDGVVVIDYKTGAVKPTQKSLDQDPVVAGTYLQLPIYAVAVSDGEGPPEIGSYYWFVTEKGGFAKRGYTVGERQRERLRDVLAAIATGIEEGVFPPNPGDPDNPNADNCRICAFDRLCPVSRRETFRRARADNDLKEYVALGEHGGSDD